MRLLRFGSPGNERPGILDSERNIRDLSSAIPDLEGRFLSRESLDTLRKIDTASLPLVEPEVRLGPCVGRVGNFIAVGLNFADHAAESGMPIPDEPILFNKAPSCIVGPNDDVVVPPGSVKTDWEIELAVVIGEPAHRVAESRALNHVAGYCICNDVSERSYQIERGGTWTKGKGCPTFGPLGPWLVTGDEIDIDRLSMKLSVNGDLMQHGSTETMIFRVPFLVSYISRFMDLLPGDVITTGTPPGVGMGFKPPRYLKPGDRMDLAIDGLGTQSQRLVASPDPVS